MAFFNWIGDKVQQLGNWIGEKWNDLTGQTAIDKQNEANLRLAKYQADINEEYYNKYQSPEAIKRQYMEAGLNPNLAYGSTSAGISSAPRMSLPQVERNMSGSEKINKALSSLSAAFGLIQGIYSTMVSKEAAKQSMIKTSNDLVSLSRNEGDLRLANTLNGVSLYYSINSPKLSFRNKYRLEPSIGQNYAENNYFARYIDAYRANQINTLLKSRLSNVADYGVASGANGMLLQDNYFGTPNIRSRNASNALKFRLMKDIGNTGTYGKLLISALDLFM